MEIRKNADGKLELRFNKVEVRMDDGGEGKVPRLVGYAARYNSLSEDLGGFKERIVPGAFAQSLKSGGDIRALVDHDHTRLLGRTSSGTLKLREDDDGLYVDCEMPDTTYARDLAVSIKRGDVAGMSFGFNIFPDGERWAKNGTDYVRELTNIDLREVTATSIPAYQATEVYVRVSPACAGRLESFNKKPNLVQRSLRLRTILCGG